MTAESLKCSCLGRWTKGKPCAMRLFCFPHAGAGAAVYSGWADLLPRGIEVCGVRYPGRESRLREPPHQSIPGLAEQLADELLPWMDLPFAFFGHSMGALVAFELARCLRKHQRRGPLILYASGRVAPHLVQLREPICHLSDAEFLERVGRMGGTPQEAFAQPELLELLLPILRADLGACEKYNCVADKPLDCPIVALGGSYDPQVTRHDLEAWQQHTRQEFSSRLIDGEHFFVSSKRKEVIKVLSDRLAPLVKDIGIDWQTLADVPALNDQEVHLWATATHGTRGQLVEAKAALAPDELRRADAFVFDVHRHRFVFRRAWIRRVLSAYTGLPAGELEFRANEHGKPELADCGKLHGLFFNSSNSDGMALLAVARGREVGVDIEAIRAHADLSSLAQTSLSKSEQRDLGEFREAERAAAFFRFWTCKEAVLKGRGQGLLAPLDEIRIAYQPHTDPVLLASGDDLDGSHRWELKSFQPFAGFCAAVATAGPLVGLTMLRTPAGVDGFEPKNR